MVLYERNKKAFNFDEDDAIRLYASKKYDGTSLSSLSHRKTFLVFFILFREWPFLDKVKLHTGHNKEWKSKRQRTYYFLVEKEKKGITNCQVFCVHSFLIAWSRWHKRNGRVYTMLMTILSDLILRFPKLLSSKNGI